MRPLIVVNRHEAVERFLLLAEVEGGRFCRFVLQGQMHVLVPAVLLWAAGFDAFDADAPASPPHRQLAQPEQRIRAGEGKAVVGPNSGGQAEPLEHTFEDGKGEAGFGAGQALTGQQIAQSIFGSPEDGVSRHQSQ